jgi:hypothetical protein
VLDPEELSRVELVALVRDQATLLEKQSALLEKQAAELAQLRAEVERLRRLTSRNSGNSSMPPSTDDLAPAENLIRPGGDRFLHEIEILPWSMSPGATYRLGSLRDDGLPCCYDWRTWALPTRSRCCGCCR